jgi:hypothetical protein
MTHEFEDYVLSDWLENKKWFDLKLLVDPSGGSVEKPMSMIHMPGQSSLS